MPTAKIFATLRQLASLGGGLVFEFHRLDDTGHLGVCATLIEEVVLDATAPWLPTTVGVGVEPRRSEATFDLALVLRRAPLRGVERLTGVRTLPRLNDQGPVREGG